MLMSDVLVSHAKHYKQQLVSMAASWLTVWLCWSSLESVMICFPRGTTFVGSCRMPLSCMDCKLLAHYDSAIVVCHVWE